MSNARMTDIAKEQSIFQEYYHPQPFVDRFLEDQERGVDVIIPIIHTNELWRSNLLSIYRTIPVKRLLIGNGGCIDNTLDVLKEFPRVTVFDHTQYVSLGYSIRKLIEEVKTGWFIYLHSDVYLPEGWFDEMCKHQEQYDWYECRQHLTVLVDYPMEYKGYDRPLSGSQMGRTAVFQDVLPKVDDDYLYRNEDIIFAELVKRAGGRYGRVDETFHYHQMMNKQSKWKRTFTRVDLQTEKSKEEEIREFTMQVKGLIKYTDPNPYLITSVRAALRELRRVRNADKEGLKAWVRQTNPAWLPYLNDRALRERLHDVLYRIYRKVFTS